MGCTNLSKSVLLALLAIAGFIYASPASAAPADPLETGRRATAYVISQWQGGAKTGTGFCVDTAGIFVTNNHVVTEKGKVVPKITLIIAPGTPEERSVPATVLKTEEALDVAILKIDKPGLLHTVDLAPPVAVSGLKETTPVMALGFPRGQRLAVGDKPPEVSVSTGKVTAIRKTKEGEAVGIQFDGSINPGNSGGPLLDENGKVIGIVYAILLDARQLNLAKPVSFIWYMLGQANVILTPKLLDDPAAAEKMIARLAAGPIKSQTAPPDAARLAAGQKLVRELFAAKYADKSPKGRQQLIADLLEKAEDTKDDPAGKYAIVSEARDLSLTTGDLASAFYATALLSDGYNVDPLELMSELVQKLAMRSTKPQDAALATAIGIVVLEAKARRDEYTDVRKLMPMVRASLAASRNISVVNSIRDRLTRLDAEATETEKAKPAIEKLKTTPDDPALNLTAGRYYCFVRSDFARGLPLLLKSGDAALQTLAKKEAENPATVDKRKELADLWWDQITKEQKSPAAYERCRQRAAMWYRLAEPDLKGLEKQAVVKRLESLPSDSRPTADMPKVSERVVAGSSGGNTPARKVRGVLVVTVPNSEIPKVWTAITGAPSRQVGLKDASQVLSDPQQLSQIDVIVFSVNQWRDLPKEQITDVLLASLKSFVSTGGDLMFYEQFAAGNMKAIDDTFDIQVRGAPAGADVVDNALKLKLDAAGIDRETLRKMPFYNSYRKVPEGTRILLRSSSETHPIAVIAPFGKGRLILFGSDVGTASQSKLAATILELAYGAARTE